MSKYLDIFSDLSYSLRKMKIKDLLYPESRMRVLQALVRTNCSLSLREIARHTQVPVYAVQLAVRELQRKKLIQSYREGNKLFFLVDNNHELIIWFREFLKSTEAFETKRAAANYQDKAALILSTLDDDRQWIEKARQ